MSGVVVEHSSRVHRARFPRLPWWLFLAFAIIAIAFSVGAWWLHHRIVRLVYQDLLPGWGRRYDSDVTVGRLSVSMLPLLRLEGEGLTFRQHGRAGSPPLLYARRVAVTAGLTALLIHPYRLKALDLQGLVINLPPAGERPRDADPHNT